MSTATHGYDNDKAQGRPIFDSVHSIGSGKSGRNALLKTLAERTALPVAIVSVTPREKGKELVIEITGHNAKKHNVLRLITGSAAETEYDIIDVIDADNLVVRNIGSAVPQAADTAKVLFHVSFKTDSEGQIVTSSGPTQFVQDGSPVMVNEDTATPANNKPLPAGLYIIKDGVVYPVTKDTATPSNTLAIPVEIVQASGSPITFTAGDINIQLSHLGANFDSTRIGNGTNLLEVNADGSINVAEISDILAALGTLNGKDFATEATLANLAAIDFSTEAKQDDIISALGDLLTELEAKADLTDTQPVSVAALPLPAGAATEAKQTEISNKLPATLGQKSTAASLSVGLSTEQELMLYQTREAAQITHAKIGGLADPKELDPDNVLGSSLIALTKGVLQKLLDLDTKMRSDVKTPSYQEDLAVSDGAVETFVAPAGARWCKIQADEGNQGNARIKMGGAATTTSGMQIQPGRSEDFDVAGDISYTMEAGGTGKLYVIFGT